MLRALPDDQRWWWIASTALAVLCTLCVGWMWYAVHDGYQPEEDQLTDQATVETFLREHQETHGGGADEPPIYVSTGIFLQSLSFSSAWDISISGYVWQTYFDGEHDGVSRGFVLPEAVDSPNSGVMEETYRRPIRRQTPDGVRTGEVIGWYVEATLRQRFDYTHYPLDHKEVWVRLWHEDFDRNVILVPDLDSYLSTGVADTFGVEEQIVLGGWDIEESYYRYRLSNYDTNFGIPDYVGQTAFPELYFNVVIRRDFLNAFVLNLVPLLVVAALLFAVLMTVTRRSERKENLGSDMTNVLAAISALFFVVLLAHTQVRDTFESQRVVYMEHFYLLMYVTLIGVAIVTYFFNVGEGRSADVLRWRDGLAFKLGYWPFTTGVALVLTWLAFADVL